MIQKKKKKNLKKLSHFGMIQIMINFQDEMHNLAEFTHFRKIIFIQQ